MGIIFESISSNNFVSCIWTAIIFEFIDKRLLQIIQGGKLWLQVTPVLQSIDIGSHYTSYRLVGYVTWCCGWFVAVSFSFMVYAFPVVWWSLLIGQNIKLASILKNPLKFQNNNMLIGSYMRGMHHIKCGRYIVLMWSVYCCDS